MKLLKRLNIIISILIIIITLFNTIYIKSAIAVGTPPRVGVLLFNFNDPYISRVKQSLENIEKANPDKVKFSFFDAKDNQAVQNADIDTLLQNNIDLLLVNLVETNTNTVSDIINKVTSKNIPLIFFNIEFPIPPSDIAKKVFVVATESENGGTLQGNILLDLWNKNKASIDKNNDNKLQYILLRGKTGNESAIKRTTFALSTLNNNGVQTEELASRICNWDRECAKEAINSLFLRFNGRIEAIISNNDAMAIGAIEALQKYGYNNGDPTKTIPVVGIDAIPEAIDLINKGFMTGTVAQNPDELANALYSIGLNLVFNRLPLEGTNYKLAGENTVKLPYHIYTKNS